MTCHSWDTMSPSQEAESLSPLNFLSVSSTVPTCVHIQNNFDVVLQRWNPNHLVVDVSSQAEGASYSEGTCGVCCEAEGPGHRHHPAVVHSVISSFVCLPQGRGTPILVSSDRWPSSTTDQCMYIGKTSTGTISWAYFRDG